MDLREYLQSEAEAGIRRPVETPEWDKPDHKYDLEVRELNIQDRAAWRRLSFIPVPGTDAPGKAPEMVWDQPTSNAALVALTTFYRSGEKAGQRVFQDSDIGMLLRLPGKHDAPFHRLLNAATDVNFLGADTAKVAEKNSKSTRKSGTSSK